MQQQMLHRFLASVLAGTFAIAAAGSAEAAGPQREGAQAQVQPGLTTIQNKKLILTSAQADSAHFALNAGFNNIGTPVTVKCQVGPCMIVVQTMVQVEETSPYWAICPVIDGVDAVNGCNWQGIASDGTSAYATGNGTYVWTIAEGNHTLQPQIYLSVSGAIDNWGMTIAKYH
jgi:hypothetical protein